MADQQPDGNVPAAGAPDPTRVEAHAEEPSTVDAPARWSGSAAVPPPAPRRSRFTRRRGPLPDDEPDDRITMPAVDPWEGQDTPWDPMPLPPQIPAAGVLPPTRIDPPAATLPPTRIDRPAAAAPPPARTDRAAGPAAPSPAAPPPSSPVPPPSSAVAPPAPRKRRWGLRSAPAAAPADRLPVAPRPPAGPLPPPPPWHPPTRRPHAGPPAARPVPPAARPMPPPRRRRRRWPRNLALFTLLGVACCCGVPGYFAAATAGQYPATAALPPSVADLDLRDDAAGRRAAERLLQELGSGAFAGVYADGNGKRVTVFGVTGLRLAPKQDLEAHIARLTPKYDIRNVQPYDLAEPGGHERCGVGRTGGATVVVCAWADHGSLATVVLTRRSVADSAELTETFRSAVLTRG